VNAAIIDTADHLPEERLTNEDLSREHPDWPVTKIAAKLGIETRRIAAPGELSSDLGVAAAQKLFARGRCAPGDIDFLLFCTQSPDYSLPTSAGVVQERLGLPRTAGALDFNLGCSGFTYGLSLAKGLVETGQARNVLLVTAETYSKFLAPDDRGVRTIFGDGAAATLVGAVPTLPDDGTAWIGRTLFGTDGRGAEDLIVRTGGLREPSTEASPPRLEMRGAEIYTYTLEVIPAGVRELLARTNERVEDIDLFVFHQANRHMLEALRRFIGIAAERFFFHLSDVGNTVSATIPMALRAAADQGVLKPGHRVVLVGFGVGYSLALTRIVWRGDAP